jgi:outer membrane protein W
MTRAALFALVFALAAPSLATAEPQRLPQRLYVRLGIVHVHPMVQSREMELADVDGPASLAVKNGPIAGSGTDIDSATIPGAIIGYVLPWLDNRVSIETILGTPLSVKFRATGTLANQPLATTVLGIPSGVMPLGSELGEAKGVPPVVTAIYALHKGALVPYVGAGVSVMFAYDAKVTNPTLSAVSQPQMSIPPAPGLVLQTGIDARVWKRVYARLDVKFIAGMLARAEVHNIQVATPQIPLFGVVDVGTAKASVWLNPLIIQAGIGTDF